MSGAAGTASQSDLSQSDPSQRDLSRDDPSHGGPSHGGPSHGATMAASNGHVAVVDGSVRVGEWRTRAPEIVRYFETRLDDGADLAESLEIALKVGVLALENTGVTVNVDYVDKEFSRLADTIETGVQSRLEDLERVLEGVFAADDGRLDEALRTYLGEGGHLADMFDPDRRDSAVGRLRELLDEHFDGEGSNLHRLLDMTNANSPLASWRDEIADGFHGLRRLLEEYRKELAEQAAAQQAGDEARAEEREKGTQKGRDFETLVFEQLTAAASAFGDVVEATGDAPSVSGAKAGDVVVTVNPRDCRGAEVRLVFEAKDKSVGLTPILRELDTAMSNRGASGAVAVYSRDEHMPRGTAPFREQGNGRYLCLFDKDALGDTSLRASYSIARFWAIADLAADDGEIDASGIREGVERARHLLGNVSSIKGKLTKMRNAVEDAANGVECQLESLRSDLVQVLDEIDGRIRLDND